ncbi:MAG: DUF3090 family protein [Chloroflexota bacterium]|nr:DUF3090 family protein [Chloroflexota bacterium]
MTILLLIRHASNDYLKDGRLAGWIPGVHLNAQGQREADALARRLNPIPISAIYSSPLERALDTATAVAACQKLEVHIREELGESRVGEWSGKTVKELEQTEEWKQMLAHPVGFHPPGGESIEEVQKRIVAALDAIVAAHPKEIVAVFSHADPLKAAIAHYLGMDLNNFNRIAISPASVTVFFFNEGGAHLFRLNDSDKLPAFKPEAETPKERKEEKKMPDANILYDLNPVTHITVGAVGKPGKRAFYLQGRQGAQIITLLSEKEQISALSQGIDQLLERLGVGNQGKTVQVSAIEMELSQPIEPVFRVGQLGLGYDAEQGLLVLVAYELPEEENPPVVNVVRFWATPDQMRALARHAAAIIAGGRPTCVLCGRPIDPEGHFCPKRNGHGAKATLN